MTTPASLSRRPACGRIPRRSVPASRLPAVRSPLLRRLGIAAALLLILPWLTFAAAEAAQTAERPRIGLVLSGGGARGIAHLGVLKVLEELRIPIDVIAGTSMGAIVGGFYASGSSPAEIEALVGSLEWDEAFQDKPPLEDLSFRRKEDSANYLIKFDAGIRDGKVTLPLGLIQGQNLQFILKSRLIHTAGVSDFDRLGIPFRAVAADIETGETVVLGRGDLSTAIRASMSIPGVFAPVEWENRLLVDGGIADNLPVDVARALGADILIAVNVGTLRRSREKLTSAMAITAQVMTIMIQNNTDEQIATLKKGDILIQPNLGEIGSSDFGDEVIRAQVRTPLGKPLDLESLSEDLKRIYSIDTFEKADFHLTDRAGQTDLRIETKEKSWGPHYLRFGMSLVDDLNGSTGYNLSASLTSTALNRLGAEWVNQFQIGDSPTFSSEFYQPLDSGLRYFVAPRIEYRSWNINRYQDGVRLAQYRAKALEGGFDAGRQFENWGQVRIGIRRGYGHLDVRTGAPEPERRFNSGYLFTSFIYNRLDNFNFPLRGSAIDAFFLMPREELGSDFTGKALLFNGLKAWTLGRHTLLAGMIVQSALDDDAPLQNSYSLGGFLNLSGYADSELSGQHTGLARLIYYYELGSAGLGTFHTPLYAGFSLEAGNAWAHRSDINGRSLIYAGSILIGSETYMGPLYLAYGRAEGGHQSLYLFLGHKF